MVSLARKTLIREWRRFLPAVLAIAFAGLLLIVQAALVLGIFGSAAVYVTASSADLWVGYPGTQSVNLGRPISADVEMLLRMNPQVTSVEPLLWVDGDWRSVSTNHVQDKGGVSVFVNGINPSGNLLFDHVLPAHLRSLLMEPGAVIVDRADLEQLGVQPNSYARIDAKPVHVVATVTGLRALGGVNIICSLDTARELAGNLRDRDSITYWVAKLEDASAADNISAVLNGKSSFGPYQIWTADHFALRSQFYWMLDTGAGIAVLFMATIVFLVGVVVASQALMSVVISSAQEYATLNALGAGMVALRRVVLEQSAWIGGMGLLCSAALSSILLSFAQARDVPVAMTLVMAVVCAALILGIALISGLLAMRGLLRADPALLLR